MYPKLDEKKVCFVTPPSAFSAYTGTAINAATQIYPYLSYQYLSAWLKEKIKMGLKTRVLDMGIAPDPWPLLGRFLLREKPKYLGLSFTTPLFYEAKLIGLIAKDLLGPELVLIHGNVHASTLYEESLTETMCDVIVKGEGEVTFGEICQGKPFNEILGVIYRADDWRKQLISAEEIISRRVKGESCYDIAKNAVFSEEPDIRSTIYWGSRPYIGSSKNNSLDDLPFPDMELYDIYRYKNPDIIAHGYPMQQVETSRGCPFTCNFCSSEDTYRAMSPDYVIELYKYLIKCGVKEFRLIDDQFLININRGKVIAQKMLENNITISWNMANGVRADRVDREFLELAARSGCYQVGGGYESGDQESLDSIQKNLDIEKSIECMKMIKELDIETVGFFMFGTPGDTERSMQKTIDFAKKLMPDFAKVTVCIPFPDTRLYADYEKRGLILSKKWDDYNIHKAARLFKHPNGLTPEILEKFYWKFYREFYLNPRYLWWKGRKSLRDGTFFRNANLAKKLFFAKIIPDSPLNWALKK
ncbi:B12-binding domain-containing radical SAM protein [Patescibacteria group bacterium]|nr:B12-binding domain-containing radical SAM protein [Patescibacteria group bacterium]